MRVVLAASCLLLLTITGTIADTQSAFIPKAKVIAKNAETGVQYETIKYANYCPRAFYC